MIISILTPLITWWICGSLISSFDNFMISVDFCKDPVTLIIATQQGRDQFSFNFSIITTGSSSDGGIK